MTLTLLAGYDKNREKETFTSLSLSSGELWAVCGPTGSGKSRLVKDLEMLVDGDSITGRRVLVDGKSLSMDEREHLSSTLIAHLGQNMRFVLDMKVEDFIKMHAKAAKQRDVDITSLIENANTITEEPIEKDMLLSSLSGGQSRALMCADIASISNRPVVLIDEIENAGIDKEAALSLLASKEKLVLIVTHDVHTALMAGGRIILSAGGVKEVRMRSKREEELFYTLDEEYKRSFYLQKLLRRGEEVV